jgi:2-oxoisovalerate dehydrogenase E1 component
VRSVAKTGRCLVLHEAPLTGGFGGELAATVAAQAFEWLDAPVARLAALDTPTPFARPLEAVWAPHGRLLSALRELLAY